MDIEEVASQACYAVINLGSTAWMGTWDLSL